MVTHARFNVGQLVRHRSYGYRGVVADIEPQFEGTEEGYEAVVELCPPDENPRYYVLVDGPGYSTFVAEHSIVGDESGQPVHHPNLGHFFADFRHGSYVSRRAPN